MAFACLPKNVLSSGANCRENPAGLSNHMFAVPLDSNFITSISIDDAKNAYLITPAGGENAALKGFRIDFKSQTGQVTSEDNGQGKSWTHIGTARVELNEDEMAYASRVYHNSDKFLYFFPTGNVVGDKKEYKVVGNQMGDTEFQVVADSGAARGDDHGQTLTVRCPWQVYPVMKWYGNIENVDESTIGTPTDETNDEVIITDTFIPQA